MLNIKLVIFDLDGTLIDAYAAISSSFNHTMRSLGLKPRSPSVVRRLVGWGDINLLKPHVPADKLEKAVRLYRAHHRESLIRYSHLYPGVRGFLSRLKKKGVKLAVASNRPSRFSLILLRHFRIAGVFDYVLCADKLKRGKPAPDILNKIVGRFGFRKKEVLYVGDMVIDAQAGRRAGVRTIIVTGGSSRIVEIRKERPFKIVHGIDTLAKMV